MELVHELFVTAFVALIFSFLVAKLVSISMGGGGGDDVGRDSSVLNSSKIVGNETVVEEMRFDRGLKVKSTKSKRRVRFVDEVVVRKIDEFEKERSGDVGVEFSAECERCDDAGGIEVGFSGFSEKSIEGVAGEIVGGFESEEVAEKTVETGLEELVIEEKCEDSKLDEFDGIKEETILNSGKIGDEGAVDEIIVKSTSNDVAVDQTQEIRGIKGGLDEGDEEKKRVDSDEDCDWEGIERSELEKIFAAALDYVNFQGKDDLIMNMGSDMEMQLYGLHKVAMEGPCHEPQPMALKVSARAKWNAWQGLGNMSPEVAMEQYISLLSDTVPGWMQGDSVGDDKPQDSSEAGKPSDLDPGVSTYVEAQSKGKVEVESNTDGGGLTKSLNSANKDNE